MVNGFAVGEKQQPQKIQAFVHFRCEKEEQVCAETNKILIIILIISNRGYLSFSQRK